MRERRVNSEGYPEHISHDAAFSRAVYATTRIMLMSVALVCTTLRVGWWVVRLVVLLMVVGAKLDRRSL